MRKRSRSSLYLLVLVLVLSMVAAAGCNTQKSEPNSAKTPVVEKEKVYTRAETVASAEDALKLLEEGNQRYVSGQVMKQDLGSEKRGLLAAKGQKPFAVVLTCSDSRVPAEYIFDQGLGDIFVVRVAGNVVDPVALGSIEYGVEHLKTPLLVVLGHEKCGAVKATVDGGEAPGSIGAIVEKIKPSADKAKAAGAKGDALYEKAADENILATIAEIEKSPVVEELVKEGHLKIVGAKYHLTSGEVTFNKE
ncbi:carbonic anhydrase [Syntrophomonas palmitatica]|uniref:carbonic anhydrase n=1 Tax=Syntrophomonas palmitatica TaxID=402877 RepID=UPI000B15F624|nr:carbonic anhydrase [Syntrophomonas palmitatica]